MTAGRLIAPRHAQLSLERPGRPLRPSRRWRTLLLTGLIVLQACASPGPSQAPSADAGASAAPGSSTGSLDFTGRTMTIQGWGGLVAEVIEKAYYGPFKADTGADIKIVEVIADLPALLKSQHDSGNIDIDMIDAWGSADILRWGKEGYLAPLDYGKIPGSKDLIADYDLGGVGLGHLVALQVPASLDKEGVKPLTTVSDFFNVEDFPGDRAASNWGLNERNIASALLADGVPPDKLYPLDVERALKVWDRVKPSVKLWYTSGNEAVSAMVDERVVYCLCFDGRSQQAIAANPKWSYTLQGGNADIAYMAMVNGTKNADMVYALLQYFTEPERQATFYEGFGVATTNPKFVDYLPDGFLTPEKLSRIPTTPENTPKWWKPTPAELESIVDIKIELEERWTAWLSQ